MRYQLDVGVVDPHGVYFYRALSIDSEKRARATALISKESSRDENCTLRKCVMQ